MTRTIENVKEDWLIHGIWDNKDAFIVFEVVDAQNKRADEAEEELHCEKWRITPNTHFIPQQDPFEGPGETYRGAYTRVNTELSAVKAQVEILTEALKAISTRPDFDMTLRTVSWRDWARTRAKTALQDACPNHVASDADPKICGRCGIHIDSLR